jgi:hypothetical protein
MEYLRWKTARLLAVCLVSFSSLALAAQQPDPSAQPNPAPSAPTAAAPSPSGAPGAAQNEVSGYATGDMRMQPVKGELVRRLDSKTARTGDSVVVKTKEPLKIVDGTVIPKGSKLVGHVTEVQAHGKDQENAKLAIQFDHAELKDGESLAIHSVIESVAPAPDAAEVGAEGSFGASPMAGVPAGGGMAGGRPGIGTTQGAPSAVPAMPTTTTEGNTADPGNGGAASEGKIVAGSGENAIRTTAIPGILLASGPPTTSGTLFGARRNVQLDAGTEMVLGVSAAPAR